MNLFIDVYMQYIMYVFLKNFRIGPKTQGGVSVTSNTIKVMDVMHLFILCVNLLTRFFVFLSVLSTLHETDGGIYIFNVFLYLVFKAVLMAHHDFLLLFLILCFSNRALSLIIFL